MSNKTFKHRDTRTLRGLPVKELTPEECRRLTVHHHGNPISRVRRQAYILRGNPGMESAYFKPEEITAINYAIENGI